MPKAYYDLVHSLPFRSTKAGNGSIGRYIKSIIKPCHSLCHYRGCVTPKQISGIKEAIEDNLDMFDGYEELPEDLQDKIKLALAEGHIADDDWTGVLSLPSIHPQFH